MISSWHRNVRVFSPISSCIHEWLLLLAIDTDRIWHRLRFYFSFLQIQAQRNLVGEWKELYYGGATRFLDLLNYITKIRDIINNYFYWFLTWQLKSSFKVTESKFETTWFIKGLASWLVVIDFLNMLFFCVNLFDVPEVFSPYVWCGKDEKSLSFIKW